MADKLETFDVVIVSRITGQVRCVVAATVDAAASRKAMENNYEVRLVPAGKFKIGDVVPKKSTR